MENRLGKRPSPFNTSSAPPAKEAIQKRSFSRALFAQTLVQRRLQLQARVPTCSAPMIDIKIDKKVDTDAMKIGIIGAGMAGLYAALILDSLELTNYEILEANPDRVGGRVFTKYFESGPLDQYFGPFRGAQKWNYIDYGAMRFPCIAIMDRVIGSQKWSLTNYLNCLSARQGGPKVINLIDYYLSDDNNILYYNSVRKTRAEVTLHPEDPLHFGKSNNGGVDDKYVQKNYKEWLDPVFGKFKELLKQDFETGFEELLKQDHLSCRAYLRKKAKYPEEFIDYLETLDSGTGHYDEAFTEAVLDSFEFDSPAYVQSVEAVQCISSYGLRCGEGVGSGNQVAWKCVEGGTGCFPYAMQRFIRSKPQMGKRVTKIAPASKGSPGGIDVFVVGEKEARNYHHVINTLPPAVLRSQVDTTECNFSYDKRTALRVLHVDSSVKIGLLFKYRWWQDKKVMNNKPIKGGQSSTDLPVRCIVYPSYGIGDPDAPGVLIASYAWGQDAARISDLSAAACKGPEVVQLALSNIAEVHGLPLEFLQEQFVGQYHIQDWNEEMYSQGAFALFGPGQFVTLYPGLIAAEMDNCYHTAGEMASEEHAWIVGALNSALRCVHEILCAAELRDKVEELKAKWGYVEEVV